MGNSSEQTQKPGSQSHSQEPERAADQREWEISTAGEPQLFPEIRFSNILLISYLKSLFKSEKPNKQ